MNIIFSKNKYGHAKDVNKHSNKNCDVLLYVIEVVLMIICQVFEVLLYENVNCDILY